MLVDDLSDVLLIADDSMAVICNTDVGASCVCPLDNFIRTCSGTDISRISALDANWYGIYVNNAQAEAMNKKLITKHKRNIIPVLATS